MITKIIKLTVAFVIVLVSNVCAQSISGKVIDNSSKEPLSGVSIKVVGTSNGATTDANGAFSVKGDAQAKLDVSQVGYAGKRVSVNGQQEITIELSIQQTVLESVTVTTGSRSAQRTLTETPLPIDIISANDG